MQDDNPYCILNLMSTFLICSGSIKNMNTKNKILSFGMLMNGGATSVQPFKYSGKELDRMHGLNWYDHGARMSDPALGRWHVVDPLAEKYYDVSPYVMCGNDPVNCLDPDGKEIWVQYIDDEGKLQSFQYQIGMACEVANEFASKCVNILNELSSNEFAEPVMNELVKNTDYSYNISPNKSEGGPNTMQFDPTANGANINAALILNKEYSLGDLEKALGHELYHGYEQMTGNDPATVNGEVDAYLFESMIGVSQDLGNSSLMGLFYTHATTKIRYGDDNTDYYYNALTSFKQGSHANRGGLYNKHHISTSYRSTIQKRIHDYINMKNEYKYKK